MRTVIFGLMTSVLLASTTSALFAADEPEAATLPIATVDLFDAPSQCVVEEGKPDLGCRFMEEQLCAAHCEFDEFGNLDCNNNGYWICMSDIDRKCPDLPDVVEQTRCGECIERPTHWITCTDSDGGSATFACNQQIKEAYESNGLECSACTYRNPPGKYKSCRCGDTIWREHCPEGISTDPPPEPPFCKQHPEQCVSAEPLPES